MDKSLSNGELLLQNPDYTWAEDYRGIWGAKVFWLATFTLLPVLLSLKLNFIELNVSIATIIYCIYHGLGIFIWMHIKNITSYKSIIDEDQVKKTLSLCHKINKIVKVLGIVVIFLIAMTLVAKTMVVFGNKKFNIPLPKVVYYFLGIVEPKNKEEINSKIDKQINKLPEFEITEKYIIDRKNNLLWSRNTNGKYINWEDAKNYCENYKEIDISDGWRMPTTKELNDLYKYGINKESGYINFLDTSSLWSIDSTKDQARYFDFHDGQPYFIEKSKYEYLYVVPVHPIPNEFL